MDYALRISKLKKRFGKQEVLKGLDLEVPTQSVYGFIGRNGAGKSTTIKTLLGLLPFESGQCEVLGSDIRASAVGVRSRVGYMAENQTMYGWMTVRQIIDWVGRFYESWNPSVASSLQNQFQLNNATRVAALSKGQTSKLALLLALAHEPELVVLDDPTLGLDPIARKEFLREVIGQLQERRVTVFFSSHLLYEIEPICDYIGIIDEGRMIMTSTTDELRQRVKRVVCTLTGHPKVVTLPRMLDVDVDGRSAAIVTDDVPQVKSTLTQHGINSLEIQDLNLDEIFEAYVIGRSDSELFRRQSESNQQVA